MKTIPMELGSDLLQRRTLTLIMSDNGNHDTDRRQCRQADIARGFLQLRTLTTTNHDIDKTIQKRGLDDNLRCRKIAIQTSHDDVTGEPRYRQVISSNSWTTTTTNNIPAIHLPDEARLWGLRWQVLQYWRSTTSMSNKKNEISHELKNLNMMISTRDDRHGRWDVLAPFSPFGILSRYEKFLTMQRSPNTLYQILELLRRKLSLKLLQWSPKLMPQILNTLRRT